MSNILDNTDTTTEIEAVGRDAFGVAETGTEENINSQTAVSADEYIEFKIIRK